MANRRQPAPDDGSVYFQLQADMGVTKHLGGRHATDELVALCHLGAGQYVLEVGCGLGRTACYLAEELGCRVVGVDLNGKMIERAKERAERRGLENQVEFRVADARDLPFQAALFDAVIDESVTGFVGDKPRAVGEYVRVAKAGGYVGLNEATWVSPPSPELLQYVRFIMGRADFLKADGWRRLLEDAGLSDVQVSVHRINMAHQYVQQMREFDARDYFGAWRRFLTGGLSNPAYWRYTKQVMGSPRQIVAFIRQIGYGLYAGRK